ncbi:outer membrane receptor protein involved in Fe transport [Lewinella aquimaris]|uniref:Outer membrane receptor protein involved in Fe transport n=1 Tax=Neolewinella aquimaris TaxID=1835722 RepID=A0A840E4R8_9BACT|nr:outer membrane beta-barrel family protein [Neolewinella aquimaris]MBB4078732.1 outer membrane receptor protein involved in Fe transport [Neolewinella aquimaris]
MKPLYTALLILLCTCVRAQTDAVPPEMAPNTGGVGGQLRDGSSEEPVGFANIAVYRIENGELVGGTTSDIDGKFTIKDLPYGDYRLEVTFIGYEGEEMMLELNDSERFLRVGDITLEAGGATDLDEVVVTADRAIMELGLDRKSFNVEKSVAASGGSAEDLLRQIPSITVDLEGNVSLRGSGGVRFLINGKPSGLVGTDPATYLKSLSSSSIERVEVITNPGAAYDPEGTAGIINIVLKKKQDDGFNATVNLNAGTGNKFDGNLDLNWRQGKFNSFAGVSGRYDERFFRGFRDQTGTLGDSTFSRYFLFEGDRLRKSQMFKLGTEYNISERGVIGLQGNIQFEQGESNNLRTTDFFNNEGGLDRTSVRTEFEPETENDFEVQATYFTTFKKEGRQLSSSFQYSENDEEEIENYNEILNDASGIVIGTDQQRAPTLENRQRYLGQLDYEQTIGDFKFTTGWRTTLERTEQDAAFQTFDTGSFENVDSLSNLFRYEEDVHAVYATFGGQVDKIRFNVGLRAEQANTSSILLEPNAEDFTNNYFKVYPSIFAGYEFDDNTTLQASYSRRIERPRGYALNPFVDRGDPFNLRSGNPFLLPELINSFELNVQQQYGKGTFTGGVYFRQLNDIISRITRVLPGGVSLSTRDNLDRGRDYGIELITTYRPTDKLDLTVSGNGYRSEIIGNNQDENIDQNGYLFSGNVQGSYELPGKVQAQFTYFYRSPGVRPQGRIQAIQSLDLGFRKEILDDKGAITLRVTDLFNQRKYRFTTETGGITTVSEFQRESRIVYLGFQYSLNQLSRQRNNNGRRGDGGGEDDF